MTEPMFWVTLIPGRKRKSRLFWLVDGQNRRALDSILICLIKVESLQIFTDVFCSPWCDKPVDTIIDMDKDLQSCN